MTQITAFQLACYRSGRRASASDCLKVRVPPFGMCARCLRSIDAVGAYPTRFGYWVCSSCIRPSEGWTDVREANRDIFQKGQQ